MPGLLCHVGATAICAHGGQVSVISTNTRVLVSGQPVATLGDTYPIVGCPFTVSGNPHPCVKVQWLVPAARVTVNGQPVILQTSSGMGLSAEQVPQGPPTIVATQTRVVGE
jgi:uncharacterized Zn-binding protein involved in type VI secretion